MLIRVENDAFNIAERILSMNEDYFVVYNTNRRRFEIHNKKQYGSTFCITCDEGLNYQVIQKLRKTKIENMQKIMYEIEKTNQDYEQEIKRVEKDKASFKAREMFNYACHHDDCDFSKSYTTRWC